MKQYLSHEAVASPVTASHDVVSVVWLEHGIWNTPPVLPLDNITTSLVFSVLADQTHVVIKACHLYERHEDTM